MESMPSPPGEEVGGGGLGSKIAEIKQLKSAAEIWSKERLTQAALDALEAELFSVLKTPSDSLKPEAWEIVKAWLEAAISDARNEDDLPAKRRLRQMVVSGVCISQRNIKLWRQMNALRSVVEEVARARPPLSKAKEAFLQLGVMEQNLQSEEENCNGDMEKALEKIAREDPETVGNEEGRIFGAKELRRLSHDSTWLLVHHSFNTTISQQKLLYLALCKVRELYNGGRGVISLETKQRLKRATCSGHVESVLLLLKIAHEGSQQDQQYQEAKQSCSLASTSLSMGTEEEKTGWAANHHEMEDENEEDFTFMKNGSTEASFKCGLTGHTLRRPVTLPCQHSFSKDALEAYLQHEEEGKAGGEEDLRTTSRRCPNPLCRQGIPAGPLSINRALDENIMRYFPRDEVEASHLLISPGTKNAVAKTSLDIDPIEALGDVGFTDEQIGHALEREGINSINKAVVHLMKDTTPVPAIVTDSAITHSDLRRLNLDTLACLIEAISTLNADATKADRRMLFELLCRIDILYCQGEGVISRGFQRRLQRALMVGMGARVDTILRFLGASELPDEVDVEMVLQDQLTGIVLVDPVTLGCGHTFGQGALTRYLSRKPQTHRLCPLCNWSIPLDFQSRIDPLLSYILARSFDDKVKSDLESVQDALSTTPLVITILTSYQNNTEVLLKALQVLAKWAEGGPSNRVYLNFYGVVDPLLDIIREHGHHQQLIKQTLTILLTLAEDQGPVLAMVRAGALSVLASFSSSSLQQQQQQKRGINVTGKAGVRDWPESVRIEVEREMLRLVTRILRALPRAPDQLFPNAGVSSGGEGGAISTAVHQQVLVLLEQNLSNARGGAVAQGQDVLDLMVALSKITGPAWLTEKRYEAVIGAIQRVLVVKEDWDSVGGDAGLWSLLMKFLEKAFDASGLVKEPMLAKAFVTSDHFETLERLMARGGPETVEPTDQAAPQPPMFFVNHSGCSLDESSTIVSATLGGEAGAEYGFGAYALGPCIPAGHAGAWEVKLSIENHQDQDPTWVGEEFIVLGISTTPNLSPDWTFYQKEGNPISGINCSTGQVLVWGKAHAHYPSLAVGDTMRLGVDLRGSKHYLVLHKFTPDQPDRLLFRIALPERIQAAYPAVIIFNRLSYTSRAYSAELTFAPPSSSDFEFISWMNSAEMQEKKRNGPDRGHRHSISGGATLVTANGSTVIKFTDPLPKTFSQQGDVLTRSSRLGIGLQRVSGRETFGIKRKGVHTFIFRPKSGAYHVVGLSDGMMGGYPPLPPVASFHIEFQSTGLFQVLSPSGPVVEKTLKPYHVGGAETRGEADEVRLEVVLARKWDEAVAPTTIHLTVYHNRQVVLTQSFDTFVNPAIIRPFVGLVAEHDAIASTYLYANPETETQSLWLSQCLDTLRALRQADPESPARKPSFQDSNILDHLSFLAEILAAATASIDGKVDALSCLEALQKAIPSISRWAEGDIAAYWALFRALRAFPPASASSLGLTSIGLSLTDSGAEPSYQQSINDDEVTDRRLRIYLVELVWLVAKALLEARPELLNTLVDAGLIDSALSTLDGLGDLYEEGGTDAGAAPAAVVRARTQEDRIALNILAVLETVAKGANVYHHHSLASRYHRVVSYADLPRDLKPGWSVDKWEAKGGDKDELDLSLAAAAATSSVGEAVRDKILDMFLVLLQATICLPPTARESLLVQRSVDRLLLPLRQRLKASPQDAQLVEALGGILSSGDEHAWELVVREGQAMRQPRLLPVAPSSAAKKEVDQSLISTVEEMLSKATSYSWAEYRCRRGGPWIPEHWEEALFGALADGDETWVIRTFAGAGRWKTIGRQACFTSRRGSWRETLDRHLPCTALQALHVLQEQAQELDRPVERFVRVEEVLYALEKVLRAREGVEVPSSLIKASSTSGTAGDGSSMERLVIYEKADRTMGMFECDVETCVATFGFKPGDRVRPRRHVSSFGTIIGMANRTLWIHWDEDAGASFRDDNYHYMDLELVDRIQEAPIRRTATAASSGGVGGSSSSGGGQGLWPVFASSHLLEAEDDLDCNYQTIREGGRVTRGPTWRRDNEDGMPGNLGTVIRKSGDDVTVKWDGSDQQRTYRYSTSINGPHDVAWVFTIEDMIRIGSQIEVVRGPNWRFGNQDGGFNNPGQIRAIAGNFLIISWNGTGDETAPADGDEDGKQGGDFVDDDEATDVDDDGERRPKTYGYWYGQDYREVEVLVRGCERLSTVDSRKEHSLVDRQALIFHTLRDMLDCGSLLAAVEAMHVIVSLAATPMPSITYELVHTCRVDRCIMKVLHRPEAQAREAAVNALVALVTGGRAPVHRLLIERTGDDSITAVLAKELLKPNNEDETEVRVKAVVVVALRHLLQGASKSKNWDATTFLLSQLKGTVSGAKERKLALENIIQVLAQTNDLHVLHASVVLLQDLADRWSDFKGEMIVSKQYLSQHLGRLGGMKEACTIVGPTVLLLVEGLGMQAHDPNLVCLIAYLDDLSILERLKPFDLLRLTTWPPAQRANLLRSSGALLQQAGDPDAVSSMAIIEDALDLYVGTLKETKEKGVVEWAGPLAAACEALRVLVESAGMEMLEELENREVGLLLASLLDKELRQHTVAAIDDSSAEKAEAITMVIPSYFSLLESYTAALLARDQAAEALLSVTSPSSSSGHYVIDTECLEVSTGSPAKAALVDGHLSTYWQSTERVRLTGSTVERRGGPSRTVRRPDNSGHYLTVHLPAPIPGVGPMSAPSLSPGIANLGAPPNSTSIGGSGQSPQWRPLGGGTSRALESEREDSTSSSSTTSTPQSASPQAPGRLHHSPSTMLPSPSPSSSSSLESITAVGGAGMEGEAGPNLNWSRLEIRRGIFGNFTPCDLWVLVRIGAERYTVVRRHALREKDANGWETLVERSDLDEYPGADAIRIEIYRNHARGNNSRVSGLRFAYGKKPPSTFVVQPESILGFLRDYKGGAHQFLAPALSVLYRMQGDRAIDQLRFRREINSSATEEGGSNGGNSIPPFGSSPHVGSLVRCKWSKSGGMHPAIVCAVYPNQTYDVHYHDGDRDFARPRDALEAVEEHRDYSRIHRFLEEVVARVRQANLHQYFDPSQLVEAISTTAIQPFPCSSGGDGGGARSSLSEHLGFFSSLGSRRPGDSVRSRDREQDEVGSSREPLVSEHIAEVGRREAERLRECLEEAQRALTEGAMDDESVRAQIEEQLGLYRRLVGEQERRLLEHMRQTDSRNSRSNSDRLEAGGGGGGGGGDTDDDEDEGL